MSKGPPPSSEAMNRAFASILASSKLQPSDPALLNQPVYQKLRPPLEKSTPAARSVKSHTKAQTAIELKADGPQKTFLLSKHLRL